MAGDIGRGLSNVAVRTILKRALADTRGNVALMFALIVIVLVGVVGGSIDVGMLYTKRSATQDALDAAALYAAGTTETDPAKLRKIVDDAFAANIKGASGETSSLEAFNYDPNTQTITTTASGAYAPLFMGFFGAGPLTFRASSTTQRAIDGTLEIALVLDNTYSMSVSLDGTQTKMAVLKQAAENLRATIMTPKNKDGVKLAVVPYGDYVNVGMANRNASWMSVVPDFSVYNPPGSCYTQYNQQCIYGQPQTCGSTKDGVTTYYSCTPRTCINIPGTGRQVCPSGSTTYYKWYGCALHQAPGGVLSDPDPLLPYVGLLEQSQTCGTPIQPLTNDANTIKTAISNLNYVNYSGNVTGFDNLNVKRTFPTSMTFVPGGLIWGVNVLSPPAPFSEGAAYDSANKMPRKTMILMTDGANNAVVQSNGLLASDPNPTKTYADQGRMCDYAKSQHIEIYTIGFGVNDPVALAALKDCATDSDHYFDAQSSASLVNAFQVIAGTLSKVRISK